MITSLLIVGILNCNPAWILWNKEEGLNKRDLDTISRLRQRCGKDRYVDTPCLKYVRKVSKLNYHVVCTFEPRN